MNEDMSDMIKNLSSMLNGKDMPEDIKNIISNFASNNVNTNSNNSNDDSNSNSSNNEDISSDSRNNNSGQNTMPDIYIGMILKMKKIMDSMKNNKDDPRANLLLSLKPYLKDSRQEKVDQYVKLFNMSKVFEVINPLGGDKKNGI